MIDKFIEKKETVQEKMSDPRSKIQVNHRSFWDVFVSFNGFIVLGLTAVSYTFVMLVNYGYALYFRINSDVLSVTLIGAIPPVIGVGVILTLIYALISLSFSFISKYFLRIVDYLKSKPALSFFLLWIYFDIFQHLLNYYIWDEKNKILSHIWSEYFILFLTTLFVLSDIFKKRIRIAFIISEIFKSLGKLFKFVIIPLGLFAALYTIVFSMIGIGYIIASASDHFFLVRSKPDCVIIYSDSERFVCSTFDINTGFLGPDYKVLFYKDNQDLIFTNEEVGPLRPKPLITSIPTPPITPTIVSIPQATITVMPTITP